MDRKKIEARLEELIDRGEKVVATRREVPPVPGVLSIVPDKVDSTLFKEWSLDVLAALETVFGGNSPHVTHAKNATTSDWRAKDAENLLSILKSALNTFRSDLAQASTTPNVDPSLRIARICDRFNDVVRYLRQRHANRDTLDVKDEYDVQDLLHALLRIDFDDIRDEEWTPSFAGASSRIDFVLKAERIVVEVKMARKGLDARTLGEELIVDIARYRVHPECDTLICFTYDPEGRIKNAAGVERDLEKLGSAELAVRVLIRPR